MLKETLARGVTTLYVKIKYPEHSFQFQDFNYESHFGNYIISYTDQDEQRISLMLEPKFFPVLIIYDPSESTHERIVFSRLLIIQEV